MKLIIISGIDLQEVYVLIFQTNLGQEVCLTENLETYTILQLVFLGEIHLGELSQELDSLPYLKKVRL